MVSKYEKIKTEVVTRKLISCECNKCGQPIKEENFKTRDHNITMTSHIFYPIDGDIPALSGWTVSDLCPTCADWLREVLESSGVLIEPYE